MALKTAFLMLLLTTVLLLSPGVWAQEAEGEAESGAAGMTSEVNRIAIVTAATLIVIVAAKSV